MPIYIDGVEYPAAPDKNLLEHGLSLGLDIPYFCWHPAMGSVGACRQCAVKQYKDEHDERGRLVMSCMTAATDGGRFGLAEPEAQAFRASVIEWLMVNHPHDCPVCEEGGECHLQDMTVMTGHDYRRYRGLKRTFRNQYLGPFVQHEMNRCIACYRCVRFYRDYAGGDDLAAFAAHHHVYFGRHADGVLESEFSGNLVEVCPTGVFTDKAFSEHYVRKWDLQSAPSICPHCSLGCNTTGQERYGRLRRIVNRYNGDVNGYFICDRGRYGYGYVNSAKRLRTPLARSDDAASVQAGTRRVSRGAANSGRAADARSDSLEPVSPELALDRAAEAFAVGDVIGIGSPRASLEANFALRRVVGEENFYAGISALDGRLVAAALDILRSGGIRTPSQGEAAQADAVLVLGEDLTNTAPRLALTLRTALRARNAEMAKALKIPAWQDEAVRDAGRNLLHPLFVATPAATKLDAMAAGIWRGAPAEIAQLGSTVARLVHAASNSGGAGTDASAENLGAEAASLAHRIATTLRDAERPLVVAGTSSRSVAVIEAAADVARALGGLRGTAGHLCLILPEANSLGLALLGGRSLEEAFERARGGNVRSAIVLENDLFRRARAAQVEHFVAGAGRLVVLDHLEHETLRAADIALPAAAVAESDGTLVSAEGRAQRFFQVFVPQGDIRESWRWLAELGRRAGRDCRWDRLDDVLEAIAREHPALAGIVDAAPSAAFRIAGRKLNREPARWSGRTAMHADVTLREPAPPQDSDSALAFTMEGYHGRRMPPALIPYFWAPAWNSVQSVNKFQEEIAGPLRGGNPGVRLLEPHGSGGGVRSETTVGGSGAGGTAVRDRAGNEGTTGPGASTLESASMTESAAEGASAALRLVALHHLFGSEELSAESPPIAERAPSPYVGLNPADAADRSLADGAPADVVLDGDTLTLPVALMPSLARGTAALPSGLGSLPPLEAEVVAVRPAVAREGAPS
jgi:NADH-quinone oxidoreductase subunit G